jgi:hypothetical protein
MTTTRARRTRKAVVLLAVLVVVVLLSLAAYKYSDYVLSESRASEASIRATQAKLNADSGVHYVAAMLAADAQGGNTLNSNPWNNPDAFQSVSIGAPDRDGNVNGRFTILSLRSPDDVANNGGTAYNFGCSDEAAKINLNSLLALDNGQGDIATTILMAFSDYGMTADIAASILDWMDPDDTPRTSGAENDYYGALSPAYKCKNGPLDSLEELLLVKGMTPQLLFGNDRNRNGSLDPDEGGSGTVDLGLSAYFTVYSREANADSTGKARINLNGQDLNQLNTQLTTALGEDLANFILAYKLYGGTSTDPSTTGGKQQGGKATGKNQLVQTDQNAVVTKVQQDLANLVQSSGGTSGAGSSSSKQGRKTNPVKSVWDLVNCQVQVSVPNGKSTRMVAFPSPLSDSSQQRTLLPLVLDKCTTASATDLRPRVNLMTASQVVLTALQSVTNLQDTDVQTILTKRQGVDMTDPVYKSVAWLITDCNLPVATLKQLEPYVTGVTQVYRIQSIGYSTKGGPVARVEAVIDTNMGRPRIAYYRDLTELGKGFDLPQSDR